MDIVTNRDRPVNHGGQVGMQRARQLFRFQTLVFDDTHE
jgi:hypothetical protein